MSELQPSTSNATGKNPPPKTYCSQEQKAHLINFLKEETILVSGKFTNKFTYKDAAEKWQGITNHLNAIPGAKKTWKQWRKTWQDLRSKTKSKSVTVNKYVRGTGGGPPPPTLTDSEKTITEIISPVAINGNIHIPESNIEFDFDLDENSGDYVTFTELDTTDKANTSEKSGNDTQHCSSIREYEDVTVINKKNVNTPSVKPEKNHATPSQKKNFIPKRLVAAKRLQSSTVATECLAELSKQKLDMKRIYYEEKIKLLTRQVVAIEKMAASLENNIK